VTRLILDAGYILQQEGTDASAFFVILAGAASVAIGDRTVGALRDGHFFGGIGLLDHGPNVATVTAATRIDVLVFSRIEFRALLEVAPSAAVTIMRAHATDVRVAHGEVIRDRVKADLHDEQDTRLAVPGPSLPAPLGNARVMSVYAVVSDRPTEALIIGSSFPYGEGLW
jgi:CRP-like cAMP-binding protein